MKVNMHEAKTNLSKLVDKALEGEEIILARSGKAVVKLVPINPQQQTRPIGLHKQSLTNTEAQAAMTPISEEDLGFYPDNLTE